MTAHYNPEPRLNLTPVMRLLEYLFALDQSNEDRLLTWAEDEQACFIAKRLAGEHRDNDQLKEYIESCIDPDGKKYRSLGTWYMIAKSTAHCIECCG